MAIYKVALLTAVISISAHAANTYYIDSVGGNDLNPGTNAEAAWKTIARFTNAVGSRPNGVTLYLARGSHWRETLVFGTNNLVQAYGNGPRPILDASDIATNTLWQPEGTLNVWYYTVTVEGGSPGRAQVIEDGVQLMPTNSIAAVSATPGTFFSTNDPPAMSVQQVFIHPRNSTDPTQDGKMYEIATRNRGFYGGNNTTVIGLHTRNNLNNNGSFELRRNGYAKDVLAENGTKHNFFIASGVAEDCEARFQSYDSSASMFISHDTVDGQSVVYLRCLADGSADRPAQAGGFGSHVSPVTSNSGYRNVAFLDCRVEHANTFGYAGVQTNGLALWLNPVARHMSVGGWGVDVGTNLFINPVFLEPATNLPASAGMIAVRNCRQPVFITGARLAGATIGVKTIGTNTVTVTDSVFFTGRPVSSAFQASAGAQTTYYVSNTIVSGFTAAYSLVAGSQVAGADFNVFNAGAFRVNGTNHNFGSYRAQYPDLDANSTTNNIGWTGSPAEGDFSYSDDSPAALVEAGPGWHPPVLPFSSFDPVIESVALKDLAIDGVAVNGTNVVLTGGNGIPGRAFQTLASTNLTDWSAVATNRFDGDGEFAVTNLLDAVTAGQFFRLSVGR